MNEPICNRRHLLTAAALLSLHPAMAHAQSDAWPQRPLKLVGPARPVPAPTSLRACWP